MAMPSAVGAPIATNRMFVHTCRMLGDVCFSTISRPHARIASFQNPVPEVQRSIADEELMNGFGAAVVDSKRDFRDEPLELHVVGVRDEFTHDLMNASRSALILSFSVEQTPCGAPGYSFSVAFFTSFDDRFAEAAIGTI
jgi:hypothetical protein